MIRVGTIADAEALQQSCYSGTPLETLRAGLDPAEEPERVVFVAVDADAAAIASCTLIRHQHRLQRRRAEITGFVIAPDHRGTGLARRIVDHCADYALSTWDALTLELCVRGGTHAHTAYLGLGFVQWARMPDGLQDRDRPYDDVRLYRRV